MTRIINHISSGKDSMLDIPIELDGTPFENAVLELLRKVPPGEVVTYGEIAKRLGRQRLAGPWEVLAPRILSLILVPCHRVVPSSGGVGNYTSEGGPSAKVKLLEREGASHKITGSRIRIGNDRESSLEQILGSINACPHNRFASLVICTMFNSGWPGSGGW